MKKIFITAIILTCSLFLTACNSSDYKRAEEYLSSGKYDAAIEMFESLGDYKDSADRANDARFAKADAALAEGQFDDAIEMFESLGNYKDSADRANEARFAKADAVLADGQFDDAIEMFTALGEYSNASEKVCDATYKKAEQLVVDERLEEALELFLNLGSYSDATNRAAEVEEMMKIHATAVALDKSKLSLSIGKTAVLSATMEPSDTTDIIESWKSSDETIATVNAEGKITAVKAGTTVISVTTSNGLSTECTVTVTKPTAVSASNISAGDKAKAKAAYASLKSSLKFPDTLKIYNVWAFDLNDYTKIEIEYSAENNYGQSVRKFFNATFSGNTLTITKTTTSNPINSSGFLGSNVRNLGTGSVY